MVRLELLLTILDNYLGTANATLIGRDMDSIEVRVEVDADERRYPTSPPHRPKLGRESLGISC